MALVRWLWDQSPADVDEHDFLPYPDEISKTLEESYLLMGLLMSCDVGKGRVVEMTRMGLVQYVKGEPGRWRRVEREVPNPDATHVTTHTRPAPPASSLPPASAPARRPARPSLTGQASTSTLLEYFGRVDAMGVGFSAGGSSSTAPRAAVLASVSRDELHRRDAALSSAAEPPFRQMYPMFQQRAVTPPPTLRAGGMPEPRSASPPAGNGKKRVEDDGSDFEVQPPPAKLPKVAARPVAVQKADGSWKTMSSRVWGPRTADGEARNDAGEVDEDGLWRYHVSKSYWVRDRKPFSRGLRNQGLISLGTRKSDPETRRVCEERHEQMVGGRRASRGVFNGLSESCAEMLKAGLSHVIEIALAHPEHGPFVWASAGEADMAPQREAVAARIDAKFGPMLPLSSLDASKPNVNSLLTLIDAFVKNEQIMIVDTEFHQHDDTAPDPRWKAREVYDLAIACTDWDGKVVESQRWLERHGRLSDADLEEARDYLAARPSLLVCCWGSPEFNFFRAAGRKAADGSDGFDVREAILQVLPGMRHLASADVTRQFSLSMNVLTPLFGLRHAPYHTALADCEGEAVVITAFIRYISRSQRMPPPPPAATWDADDDDVFE